MENEYFNTLKDYVATLKRKVGKKEVYDSIDFRQRLSFAKDLQGLTTKSFEDRSMLELTGKLLIDHIIPYLSRMIMWEDNPINAGKQMEILKDMYRMAGRVSLKHFILFYEWDWGEKQKFLEVRQNILDGYCHYLEEIIKNPNFLNVLAELPSGYGKSRLLKYAEAWSFGIDNTKSILAICSNDALIRAMSRSVIDIIQSPEFGMVFPHMDYAKNNKMFTKETDGEWRLATCSLVNSYMAVSRDSNAVGLRASTFISLDDMYTDFNEALNNDLNKKLWNKYITVYRERFVKGYPVKMVAVGTKWSAFDLLSQIEEDLLKSKEFVDDPIYPYVQISTDGTTAIIKVPAVDENGESTCPRLISTEELMEKKEKIPSYLWLCNYQQLSVPPEGLDFDYSLLLTYKQKIHLDSDTVCFATLDPARKGKNFVSMPIFTKMEDGKHAIIDALFKKKAMTDLYDEICMLIKKNKVIKLVVENNTDTSLPYVIEQKLKESGIFWCEVVPMYSYVNKEQRIQQYQGVLRQNIVFPEKGLYPIGTDLGRLIDQMTSYSFEYPNKFDKRVVA